MIDASLLDFVKTGEIGPIHIGQERGDVLSSIGKPNLWGTEEHMVLATIWRYGDIEIYFNDNKVDMIFSDHDNLNDGGNSIKIDSWGIKRDLNIVSFQKKLQDQGVSFKSKHHSSKVDVIVNESSLFTFYEQKDGSKRLLYWLAGRISVT